MEVHHYLTCAAPAKINLTLAVLGRRPDGFHEIESWVMPVDLCDCLRLAISETASLQVQGNAGDVPADERNLAWTAMTKLAEAAGREPNVRIELDKRIPVGGGLGGGSSDAAAALIGLNMLWELGWPRQRLADIAADVGSDVPLFLLNGSAILRGRGERVEPAAEGRRRWIVLVVPPFSLSTPDVYRRHAEMATPSRRPADRVWQGASRLDAAQLSARLFNDLERAAFDLEPRLASLHAALCAAGDRPARMTGSGSCLFAVFDEEEEARCWARNAMEVSHDVGQVHVVRTLERMPDSAGG